MSKVRPPEVAKATHVKDVLPRVAELKRDGSICRAHPPLIGGAFQPSRLFGGLSVVQIYEASKMFRDNEIPVRMDVIFLAGGTINDPIDYELMNDDVEGTSHIRIEARQKGKLLNLAHIHLLPKSAAHDQMFSYTMPVFPRLLPRPLDCPTLQEILKRVYLDDWHRSYGKSYLLRNTPDSRGIFGIRPVDPFQFGGQNDDHKPLYVWLRLRDHLQDLRIPNKMIIPLLMSDYIVGLPATNEFDRRRIIVKSMASMTHKIHFHNNDFNPHDFFLQAEQCECINGMALTRGPPFYHDFGQDEDVAEIADIRIAFPRIFDLVHEENGVYRSDPEQIVGIFTRNRVFGGHLFTQFYLVAKEEAKKRGYQVQSLTVVFRRPGKANQPIRYSHESNRPMNSTFLSLKAEQNGKLISSGFVRVRLQG
ncbi:hypothetical protein M3Y98_01144400 [Aphelenchoides besseyi]|nr:hypothetical protein M3Y98_01144400 [Aphelenchoides besseyi]KAI6210716.1 hypothetical protein M3Y96_00357500 [Aphelenchoides besseyi]